MMIKEIEKSETTLLEMLNHIIITFNKEVHGQQEILFDLQI